MYDNSDFENFKKYESFSDEYVIDLIHNGDEQAQEYIINKYKNLVKIKARSYFIMGADKEDIIQEGMIGLYKAIRDFKRDRLASFPAFAELCVNRQVITAIKASTRQKHMPLNSYLSLNRTVGDEGAEATYIELLSDSRYLNPEEMFIGKEEKDYIEANIAAVLSKLEYNVLSMYLQGISYTEIAKITDRNEKSIDNALQRIKKKVEKILDDKNLTLNKNYAKV